jgi:hypothetical protein
MNCQPAPIALISQDATAILFPPIEWTCEGDFLAEGPVNQYRKRTRKPRYSIYDLQEVLESTGLTGK